MSSLVIRPYKISIDDRESIVVFDYILERRHSFARRRHERLFFSSIESFYRKKLGGNRFVSDHKRSVSFYSNLD